MNPKRMQERAGALLLSASLSFSLIAAPGCKVQNKDRKSSGSTAVSAVQSGPSQSLPSQGLTQNPTLTGRSTPGVTRKTSLMAGAFVADITPPLTTPLAGYATGKRRAAPQQATTPPQPGQTQTTTQSSGGFWNIIQNVANNVLGQMASGQSTSTSSLLKGVAQGVMQSLNLPPFVQNLVNNVFGLGKGAPTAPAAPATGANNTWLAGATGVLDPIQAKAIVLSDGVDTVVFCSVDLIVGSQDLNAEVRNRLAAQGILIPESNLVIAATNTHSGPGAFTKRLLWQIASTDAYKQPVFELIANGTTTAIAEAFRKQAPARLGFGNGSNPSLTINSREMISRHLNATDIDPALGVMRVDDLQGKPLAVIYNYAIRLKKLGDNNLSFSADIAADASRTIESSTGAISIFLNGAQGDADPHPSWLSSSPAALGETLGKDVVAVWTGVNTSDIVEIEATMRSHNFGYATMVIGPQQMLIFSALTQSYSAPLVQALQQAAQFVAQSGGANVAYFQLNSFMAETDCRFHGIRINKTCFATVPGEAIRDVGLELKRVAKAAGFDNAYVVGLANGHMGYVVSDREFDEGGMESFLTLFGRDTARVVIDRTTENTNTIKP